MPATLTLDDLPLLARGAAVLGTGGGGATDGALAAATAALTEVGPVPLLAVGDLGDDDLVVAMSMIGAPTVGVEMLSSADQARRVLDTVTELCGRRPTAVMPAEIGGSNGVAPAGWAARNGLALLDADAMGRAFPEGQMTTFSIAGLEPGELVMADVLGNVTVLRPVDPVWAERQARALCVASGSSSMVADHLLTGAQLRGAVIEGSISDALTIGRTVAHADDPLAALVEVLGATVLIEGKIIDVDRRTMDGFVRGTVTISGTGDCTGRVLRLEIQNENLVAIEDGAVLASVPDLITVVDTQTATAVFTELLGYGQRVCVLAWACHPIWETPLGLQLAGPGAFGYDLEHRPIGTDRVPAGAAAGPR